MSLAALLSAAAIITASTAEPAALAAGLDGVWTGALGYRDYQTDKLFELPVRVTMAALPDGATLVRASAFDDGPKTGTVWITSVETYDAKAGLVRSASFRKGKPVEALTETVTVGEVEDPAHWRLIFRHTGADNDKPAELRTTLTRDGAGLLEVEDVRPVGGDETTWRFRNQTRLTRSSDRAGGFPG